LTMYERVGLLIHSLRETLRTPSFVMQIVPGVDLALQVNRRLASAGGGGDDDGGLGTALDGLADRGDKGDPVGVLVGQVLVPGSDLLIGVVVWTEGKKREREEKKRENFSF